MQAGIVADCPDIDNSEVVCSGTCPGPNPIVLSTNALVIGNVYFLWFDGCAGASCDYTVAVLAGVVSVDPPDPTAPVTGPATGCPGGNPATYTTLQVANANNYDWVITPSRSFFYSQSGWYFHHSQRLAGGRRLPGMRRCL